MPEFSEISASKQDKIPTSYSEHTPDRPFCMTKTCKCHANQDTITLLNQWYLDGLLTSKGVARLFTGQMI